MSDRVIKLYEPDDNKWTIDLKMKIEVEKAALRRMEHDLEAMTVQLAGVQNNIAIIKRSLEFLKGKEARIVIMSEYQSYRMALPKLLVDETQIMNAMNNCRNQIGYVKSLIGTWEAEIDKLKFKLIEFRRPGEQ